MALACLGICGLAWLLAKTPRGAKAMSRERERSVPIPISTVPFEAPRMGLMDRVLAKDHLDLSLSRDPVATAVRSQVWSRLPAEMPPPLWPKIEQFSEALTAREWMDAQTLSLALDDPNLHIQMVREQSAKLAWYEAWLGPAHPDSLASRRQLAITLQAQGRPAEAEAEFRAILAMSEQLLGASHGDTLALRNELATLLLRQRRTAEAEREYRRVLTLRERTLGPQHPLTLSSANNVANAMDAQDRFAEAEAAHRDVLAGRERTMGREHPEVLQSCFNLALTLANQGKLTEAVGLAWRAEEGRKRQRVARHLRGGGVSDADAPHADALASIRGESRGASAGQCPLSCEIRKGAGGFDATPLRLAAWR